MGPATRVTLTALRATGQSGSMASKKVRPTPPPGGPALVMRPALGALLFGLSGMACGDDDGGSGETGNESGQPPMPATQGPMPGPTTDGGTEIAPMVPPSTSTTDDSADTGTSSDGGTEIPPMPGPDTTTTDDGGSSSGSDSGSTGPIPPMPPPDGGAAPDEQEI